MFFWGSYDSSRTYLECLLMYKTLVLKCFFIFLQFAKILLSWGDFLGVVLSILIFGFKIFLLCFSTPNIKVINIQIFDFKKVLDIPLIRMCFPSSHITYLYQ